MAAGWMAGLVVVVVAVVAVAAGPVAAQDEPDPTEDSLTAAGLFKSLGESAAGEVGSDLAGWALGAVGLAGSDVSSDLAGQLSTISGQLAGMEMTLEAIEDTLVATECDDELNSAKDGVDAVKGAHNDYQSLLLGVHNSGQADIPNTTSWANETVNGTASRLAMVDALDSIDTAMKGPAQTGILRSCLVNSIVPPPRSGSVSDWGTDAEYYGYDESSDPSGSAITVNAFMGYYYGYQALGLAMLHEAYHFQAQQAAGDDTGLAPDDVGEVCIDAKTYPSSAFACAEVTTTTNTVYENLFNQFTLAGLPYTTDKLILQNFSTRPLYVRSLEDFTEAAGFACHTGTPLTAAFPCGPTIANPRGASIPINIPYDGYTGWQTPNVSQAGNVIGPRGALTPGEYMNTLGFENAEHKIILVNGTAPYKIDFFTQGGEFDETMGCFFHTDLAHPGQYCSNDDVNNLLIERGSGMDCSDGLARYVNRPGFPADTNGFFDVLTGCWQQGDPFWIQRPGWDLGNTGSNAVQYRWPMVLVEEVKDCSPAIPDGVNVQGVITRCGTDFDAMFDTMVTRPPGCLGTVTGTCEVPGNTLNGIVDRSGDGLDSNLADFDVLNVAIDTAGLDSGLSHPGVKWTLFAPRDAAFLALAKDLGYTGPNDEAQAWTFLVEFLARLGGGDPSPILTDMLLYHVAPLPLSGDQVLARREINTVLGENIKVRRTNILKDLDPNIWNPKIIAVDIKASNGVAHVIDRVLLPLDLP